MPLKPVTAIRKDRRSANNAVTTMQHRHFAFIAKVIASSGNSTEDKRRWANNFAHALDGTNKNFDRARFFSAVGVDDPYVTQAAYGEPSWMTGEPLDFSGNSGEDVPGKGKTERIEGDPIVKTIVKKMYGD